MMYHHHHLSTCCSFLFVLLLLSSHDNQNHLFVNAAITFVGTSHEDLKPRSLPPEFAVEDIADLVSRTTLFASHYNASVIQFDQVQNGNSSTTTEMKPEILLVRGSNVPSKDDIVTVKSSPFGFVGAATTAYGYHTDLIIRPDDIWITILSQFSFYVNARSEELRSKFVNFEGQKQLTVTVSGYTVETAPYDDMTLQFLNLISENIIDSSLKEWFLPGFSTTTKTDEVVAAASAMCTFQDYFKYEFSIICGIPLVTLEGTVEDWQSLATKVERLLDYDDDSGVIAEWVDLLRIVTANFIESAKNGSDNNLAFWDNILYYNSNGYGTPLLSGWITVFSFFDKYGQKMAKPVTDSQSTDSSSMGGGTEEETPRTMFPTVDSGDINANVLSCPATVNDNGVEYNATLFVGQMSFLYGPRDSLEQSLVSSTSLSTSASELRSVNVSDSEDSFMVIEPRNDWALVIEDGFLELEQLDYGPDLPTFPPQGVDICYWFDQLDPVGLDLFTASSFNSSTASNTSSTFIRNSTSTRTTSTGSSSPPSSDATTTRYGTRGLGLLLGFLSSALLCMFGADW